MNEENKRFSEWEDCDCNQCEHYWTSACDGVAKDTKKPCNQYLATRKVVIPLQIEDLQKQIKVLRWAVILIAVGTILTNIGIMFLGG